MGNNEAGKEYLEANNQAKTQRHWLGYKICAFKSVACTGICAWFDHEEEDCKLLGGFWKIKQELTDIKDAIEIIGDAVRYGNK